MNNRINNRILALGNLEKKDKNVFGGTVKGFHTAIALYTKHSLSMLMLPLQTKLIWQNFVAIW